MPYSIRSRVLCGANFASNWGASHETGLYKIGYGYAGILRFASGLVAHGF